MTPGPPRFVAALSVAAIAVASCGPTGDSASGDGAGGEPSGELVVFAASSLTDALDDLTERFTRRYEEVRVVAALAGSHVVAGQIVDGAPADVFVSADRDRMERVVDAGMVAEGPVDVATNRLVVAVEDGNPRDIGGVEDLVRGDLLVALAAPEVPAGAYAAQALGSAGVEVTPVTLEANVRAVLAKVEMGEVDAGIVYASDVASAGGAVYAIAVPDDHDPRPVLPAAVLAGSPNPTAALAFLSFLTSQEALDVLTDHGFGPP